MKSAIWKYLGAFHDTEQMIANGTGQESVTARAACTTGSRRSYAGPEETGENGERDADADTQTQSFEHAAEARSTGFGSSIRPGRRARVPASKTAMGDATSKLVNHSRRADTCQRINTISGPTIRRTCARDAHRVRDVGGGGLVR